MQKRTLPLWILIGAALTIPSLAMAAPANAKPVDMQTATADNTLQTEVESASGELVSTRPSPFEINETKTFSRASINNRNNKAEMATQIEATQNSQGAMQDPQESMMQDSRQDMQNMQDPQQDMQDSQEDMQDPQDAMQDSMQPQPLIR